MSTSVRYPASAARALGLLKSHNNDIEFYVEDTSTPNLWLKLLRKYVPNNIRLNDVNVLGSREAVVQACKRDQEIDGRRKLYIIDGDMDLLTGKQKPRIKHLYRLRRYCVENYLLDEEALVSALTTINSRIAENKARQQIDLSGWLQRNRDCLERLFVCYAVTYEMNKAIKTVGFSIYCLFKGKRNFDLCEKKVSIRILKLYGQLLHDFSTQDTRREYERIRINAKKSDVTQYASGKDYIFPAIYQRIKSRNKTNITIDSFKTLVALCLREVNDPYLRRRVRKICA